MTKEGQFPLIVDNSKICWRINILAVNILYDLILSIELAVNFDYFPKTNNEKLVVLEEHGINVTFLAGQTDYLG